jgi:hypothetical protein
MIENQSHWIEHLDNSVAFHNSFGGNSPSLERLRLAQVVIGEIGDFHVSLTFCELPEACPRRWVMNGNDSLQLRLSFYDLTKLVIAGGVQGGNLDVAASFGPENQFAISSRQFNVELIYGQVKADLYPFNSAIFEEPLQWYRR